jgi:hypothetical protein
VYDDVKQYEMYRGSKEDEERVTFYLCVAAHWTRE